MENAETTRVYVVFNAHSTNDPRPTIFEGTALKILPKSVEVRFDQYYGIRTLRGAPDCKALVCGSFFGYSYTKGGAKRLQRLYMLMKMKDAEAQIDELRKQAAWFGHAVEKLSKIIEE